MLKNHAGKMQVNETGRETHKMAVESCRECFRKAPWSVAVHNSEKVQNLLCCVLLFPQLRDC